MSKRKRQPKPAAPNESSKGDTVLVDGHEVSAASVLRAAARFAPPTGSNQGKPVNACPICFGEYGGVGREKWRRPTSGTLTRINYNCNQCGHNWSADIRRVRVVEGVDWKVVETKP